MEIPSQNYKSVPIWWLTPDVFVYLIEDLIHNVDQVVNFPSCYAEWWSHVHAVTTT